MAGPVTASEVLRGEHRTISRVLGVLRRLLDRADAGAGLDVDSLAQCLEFFRLFTDACHHHKEEELLFPQLAARGIPVEGGPIGVMLEEHRLGRRHVAAMGEALADVAAGRSDAERRFRAAAEDYLALLSVHILKEDQVLFAIGDQVLTAADQADLAARFCSVSCPALTGQTHEWLTAIADALEARWPG